MLISVYADKYCVLSLLDFFVQLFWKEAWLMFRQLFEFEDFFLSNSGVELGQDKENIIACKKKKK